MSKKSVCLTCGVALDPNAGDTSDQCEACLFDAEHLAYLASDGTCPCCGYRAPASGAEREHHTTRSPR